MAEMALKIEDHLAVRLSKVAREYYDGDQSAAIADALVLLFLQPIRKDRRRLARLIDEIRDQVHAAGGVTEKEIDRLIAEYRQSKRADKFLKEVEKQILN
jgi:hypothetical protein